MGCGNSRVQQSTGAKPEKQATLATEVERARSSELPAKQDTEEVKIKQSTFVQQRQGLLTSHYKLGRLLGDGAFGQVFEAIDNRTGVKRAVKSINKQPKGKKIKDSAEQNFLNEVKVLRSMDHPNILKVFEFFSDNKNFHLVTELCLGGELFDYIVEQKHLSESLAANVIQQILGAINHCHQNSVVHRDLKPENLLLEAKPAKSASEVHVKVIDFGTSSLFNPKKKLSAKYGTAYYIAPEVLEGNYNELCDVWSIGVIMYILLCGYPPFGGKSDEQIIENVRRAQLNFPDREWRSLSPESKAMISRMCCPQASRASAQDLLADPWIQKYTNQNSSPIAANTLQNLTNYRADRKLQQAVLSFISSQLISSEETKALREQFTKIDKNGDGKLSRMELLDSYAETRTAEVAEKEVDQIMTKIDVDGSGFVDYSEFIAAAMDQRKMLNKKNLEAAFNAFDKDGSGTITADELRGVIGSVSSNNTTWERVIKEVDQDGNGELDLSEFKDMMLRLF